MVQLLQVAGEGAARTFFNVYLDADLGVATAQSENVGTTPTKVPTTVRWNLRLGVSEVDGRLMISKLESVR